MKRLLFVQSRAPHGSVNGQEGLDALLAGSAFATCSLLLLEDGVFQLLKAQDTSDSGTKNYSVSYGALPDYGVEDLYCSADHLVSRGLTTDDLVVPVTALDRAGISQLMADHDVILSF